MDLCSTYVTGEGEIIIACAHLQLIHLIHMRLVVGSPPADLAAIKGIVADALQQAIPGHAWQAC